MKLIVQLKLLPTSEQAAALLDTLERANACANWISEVAWEAQQFQGMQIHRLTYYEAKERFGLTAQVVVLLRGKVADAYRIARALHRKRTARAKSENGKRLKAGKEPKLLPELRACRFHARGGIAYDDRILRYYVRGFEFGRGKWSPCEKEPNPEVLEWQPNEVSIWTTAGRQRIPFTCDARGLALLAHRQGESDLVYRGGKWFLLATANYEPAPEVPAEEWLGVDLGIVNIATDSDGEQHSGAHILGLRRRHRRLRRRLQAKGTKSAKRLLACRRRKERRFGRWVNHNLSKRIVAKAKGTARGIALENLTHIRERVTARRPHRATLSSWSFGQLRAFLAYKAGMRGVPLVVVDPRNTSRTCPACGHVDAANRPSQSHFSCVRCRCAGHADHFAAREISRRAALTRPYGSPTVGQGQNPTPFTGGIG